MLKSLEKSKFLILKKIMVFKKFNFIIFSFAPKIYITDNMTAEYYLDTFYFMSDENHFPSVESMCKFYSGQLANFRHQ